MQQLQQRLQLRRSLTAVAHNPHLLRAGHLSMKLKPNGHGERLLQHPITSQQARPKIVAKHSTRLPFYAALKRCNAELDAVLENGTRKAVAAVEAEVSAALRAHGKGWLAAALCEELCCLCNSAFTRLHERVRRSAIKGEEQPFRELLFQAGALADLRLHLDRVSTDPLMLKALRGGRER